MATGSCFNSLSIKRQYNVLTLSYFVDIRLDHRRILDNNILGIIEEPAS